MEYKETITLSINKALRKKLLKEARGLSNAKMKERDSNIAFTEKRRHVEDMALAKELGITVEELIK